MKDELQAARERPLQRWIDQMVADFRRDFKWPQAPVTVRATTLHWSVELS